MVRTFPIGKSAAAVDKFRTQSEHDDEFIKMIADIKKLKDQCGTLLSHEEGASGAAGTAPKVPSIESPRPHH